MDLCLLNLIMRTMRTLLARKWESNINSDLETEDVAFLDSVLGRFVPPEASKRALGPGPRGEAGRPRPQRSGIA